MLQDSSHEKTDGTGMTLRGIVENLQQRPDRAGENLGDITSNKQQHDEENKAGECSDEDASDHDLGAFDGRFGDFYLVRIPVSSSCELHTFDHMRNAILVLVSVAKDVFSSDLQIQSRLVHLVAAVACQ